MKDNLLWPGFIPLAVALSGMISTAAVAAYGHYEWRATTVSSPYSERSPERYGSSSSFAASPALTSSGYVEYADSSAASALPARS